MKLKDTFSGIVKSRYTRWLLYGMIAISLVIMACNYWIVKSTASGIYSDISAIPSRKVGLVLGASKNTVHGPNLYFSYRMEAAADLYKHNKVKYLLVSGDNRKADYDEPTDMQQALIALGVPDSCIYLDYAGFRTFDSMVRCKKVFGEDSIIVVSQQFHNQRALFIAKHEGIHAIAFNAREVHNNYSLKTSIREYFARVKCVLDLFIFPAKPHFLGDPIRIGK
ncbi:MAG: YdcF family protein [Bacteroidetes bacterium]|nr:YdcF family protein [Bacteroidota bacterium]